MARKSKIEWTESTWNPITGCSKISEGCANCYAQRMAIRLQKMGSEKCSNGFELTLHENCLSEPDAWRQPTRVFVSSMSDLFHEEVPDEFIAKVFAVIARNPRHDFLILTKRADRLSSISKGLSWPGNTWLGVSVESHSYLNRIDQLRKTTAKTKFISFEPLLGNVGGLDLSGIDWAIVGGESGWHARRMEESRVIGIKDQCQQQGVSFYFKQWGGTNKKKAGRILQSQTWDEMPLYRQDGVHRETTSVLKPIL